MNRIAWLIVATVVVSALLEYSGAWAQTKTTRNYGSVAAQYQLPNRPANSVIPNDVELVDPVQPSGTVNNGRSARIQFLDNIFRVSRCSTNHFAFN